MSEQQTYKAAIILAIVAVVVSVVVLGFVGYLSIQDNIRQAGTFGGGEQLILKMLSAA